MYLPPVRSPIGEREIYNTIMEKLGSEKNLKVFLGICLLCQNPTKCYRKEHFYFLTLPYALEDQLDGKKGPYRMLS